MACGARSQPPLAGARLYSRPAAASAVPGGAMPLDSPHYVARAADDDFRQADRAPHVDCARQGTAASGEELVAGARARRCAAESHRGRVYRHAGARPRQLALADGRLSGAGAKPRRADQSAGVDPQRLERQRQSQHELFALRARGDWRATACGLGHRRSRSARRPRLCDRRVRAIPLLAQPACARSGRAVGPADAGDRVRDRSASADCRSQSIAVQRRRPRHARGFRRERDDGA